MNKIGFFFVCLAGLGLLLWSFYPFSKESGSENTVEEKKKEEHPTPPKVDPAKDVDIAAEEILVIWQRGFLIQRAVTTEEFVNEFNLELKVRFEQTFQIFKECSSQLEQAIGAFFPLQKISKESIPKYINYLEHMSRFLQLSWKTIENINVFLIQTVESARNQGLPVRYEQFSVHFQTFQQSLQKKEAFYWRLYDYLFFLDQVAESWLFDGKKIQIKPVAYQSTFDELVIDLYYALQQVHKAQLLPPKIVQGAHLREEDYWEKKRVTLQKWMEGTLTLPYEYAEIFRNYYWAPRQNFKMPKDLDETKRVLFAIDLYKHSLKRFDEKAMTQFLEKWEPLLLEPIRYWKQKKSLQIIEKQLVQALWLSRSRYQAKTLVLRFCALGLAENSVTYSQIVAYNKWQEEEQKKLFQRYQLEKKLYKGTHELYQYLWNYAQEKDGEPFFEKGLVQERFQKQFQEWEQTKQALQQQ